MVKPEKKKYAKNSNVTGREYVNALPIERAFEQGNYFLVRKLARQTLTSTGANEDQKKLVRSLLERIQYDPAALAVGVASVLFAVVVAFLSIN